ncbi:MAG: histidine kinase dimerization/phospho-acceptor domain-containing protein, partial [Devosia sp.]
MDAEWITSPTARRILMHWADGRPAWLWSADGSTLLWRNTSARLFNGKLKKDRVKLSAEPVPIKGQVTRLIRLGAIGRSSLSRVQFLAGERPVATTCSCTPLTMADGETALLLVGVDPIAADVREGAGEMPPDAMSEALFPAGQSYRLVEPGTEIGDAVAVKAGPRDEVLVFAVSTTAPGATIAEIRAEEGVSADDSDAERDLADMPEPMLPLGLAPLAEVEPPAPDGDHWVEPLPAPTNEAGALSSLFDRLAGDSDLYSPLTDADEDFIGAPETPIEPMPPEIVAEAPEIQPEPAPPPPDMIAAVIEYADDPESEPPAPSPSASHWLITGRGFRPRTPKPQDEAPLMTPEPPQPDEPAGAETAAESIDVPPVAEIPVVTSDVAAGEPEPAPLAVDELQDPEIAERVTRYNFEELGRILTDRVASEPKPEPPVFAPPPAPTGIINLNAETLVLNRLPLAILVFRDQQVLFANRALTDLLGHDSVESLRAAGIASIFPSEDAASAGPVNRLVRRDSTPLNVTARLQSVSWQGRAALMLSASASEPMRGHEGAVRAFAEIAAETRGEGYISADRSGTVSFVSAPGRAMLGRTEADLVGKPIAVLVGKPDMEPLRVFLEKPARFAETTRPHFTAVSEDGMADIALFAEGQAGIVSGYFGFIKQRIVATPPLAGKDDDLEPGMLGRLSRGIRRPLNTIIGFADLLRSSTIGGGTNERTAEYARDIRTAGLEIAVLADELDDFTRLRDGRYAPRPSDVDLGALLENCMVRVRPQAGAARVLVRSAISEQLPRVRADRSSLGQALLNLLASAIDQTPIGGSVILSAQAEEDDGIAIHVRDGAQSGVDLGERFVVFR